MLAKKKQRPYDLDKLAKAIALHETKDCGIRYGAAAVNNCFGFRSNNTFHRFKTKAESYAKFRKLWTTAYGDTFPTIRHATSWVCGWHWPTGKDCPGGSPQAWLASVSHLYKTL